MCTGRYVDSNSQPQRSNGLHLFEFSRTLCLAIICSLKSNCAHTYVHVCTHVFVVVALVLSNHNVNIITATGAFSDTHQAFHTYNSFVETVFEIFGFPLLVSKEREMAMATYSFCI